MMTQNTPAPECRAIISDDRKSIELPEHCWGYVQVSDVSSGTELPPGRHSEADLRTRGILVDEESIVEDVLTVSNRPPDCTEEVILRLLMVEQLEPGLDDSLMTPEEKKIYGKNTRYGSITKFRFSKTATSLLRFLFHDAGDFNNTEYVDGSGDIDIGETGMDGCLHTFRAHKGADGSFSQKGDHAFWEQPVEPDAEETMNLGHNKFLANSEDFEALLRLHSANDMAGGGKLESRALHFWDVLDAAHLPRLTRPDAVTLAAHAAMEAMFGFGEPLGMKYGRWYGERCAGRRPNDNPFHMGGRRRFRTIPGRNAIEKKILMDTGTPAQGIEAMWRHRKVIKEPFAMHDEHKDSWCPAASTLPAVRSHMKLTEAEGVSLFGAHSIGRVARAGKVPCNYMANMFFCPQMCPNVSKGGGMKYPQGFVWDDSPDLLDNRYFHNLMDQDFEAIPHCVGLGATGSAGPAVPGSGKQADGRYTSMSGERNQGIVRLGVMGLGCGPIPWSPVVDPNVTRVCVAGYKTPWKDQSQCEVDNCVHRCLTDKKKKDGTTPACTHVWEDASQECRSCKFECSDFFKMYLPERLSTRPAPPAPHDIAHNGIGYATKVWEIGTENWAYTLRHYDGRGQPKARVDELRQLKFCKYMDSVEGVPLLGSGRESRGHNHLVYAPGPIHPNAREWGGPGLVMNMEQFGFLHGNPTPIFNLPVDWTLIGGHATRRWVKAFGEDNKLFERTFATAWKKVVSAGWDAEEMPKTGTSGVKLGTCRKMKCTAKGGKFWCPVDILNDRLRYLPKPANLRLELGECVDEAGTRATPPNSAQPGACLLVGGFGVRGTVKCGDSTYNCCSPRACEFEKWLKKHRQADMSDQPTCPFTKEEKKTEIDKTVKQWRKGPDGNAPLGQGAGRDNSARRRTYRNIDPAELGIDYQKIERETLAENRAHYDWAFRWYSERWQNNTLPKEFSCGWHPRPNQCVHWNNQGKALEWLKPASGEFQVGEIKYEIGLDHFQGTPGMNKPV